MNKEIKYFGEYASYSEGDKFEEEEAKTYLILWKKFLLKRLRKDCYDVEVVEEIWSDRPAYLSGVLAQTASKILKLAIRANFHYELDKDKDSLGIK